MILQAQQELGLDLGNSILIGDKVSDIQAGISAGIGLNVLFSQDETPEIIPHNYCVITSLLEALPLINAHANHRC